MSDSVPPTYARDLSLCQSWKGRLYATLAYENNRDDEARFLILREAFERRYKDTWSWAHLR